MKKDIRKKLEELTKEDVYSLLLFALFRLKDTNEYSTLSELSYLLNERSLLNLIEYYGGTTITIPTVSEFRALSQGLLLYQYVNIEGIEYTDALKLIDVTGCSLKSVEDCYKKLVEVLVDYSFNTSND